MESEKPKPQPEFKLSNVVVRDEHVAFGLMMNALALAQSRGAFDFAESAKINECIILFNKKSQELQKNNK